MDSFHRAIPLIGIEIQSSDHLKAEFLRFFPLAEDRVGDVSQAQYDKHILWMPGLATKYVERWSKDISYARNTETGCKIFLKFSKFQPRYSYKIYSYKKRVYSSNGQEVLLLRSSF